MACLQHLQIHLFSEIVCISVVPGGPIDNMSALFRVMAWHQTGNKPLPEPMMTQFTDAYIHAYTHAKLGTRDLMVLMLFVLQCTDYK